MVIGIGVVGLLAQAGWVTLHFSSLPIWFAHHFAFDQTRILGIAVAAFMVTEAIFRPPFGILSDRIGRKPVILLGTIMSVASFAIIYMPNPYLIIPFTTIDGIGLAAFWTASFSFIADTVDERYRSTAISVLNGSMMGGVAVGWFVGGLVNTLANTQEDGRASFYFVSIMFILATVVGYFLFPPATRPHHEETEAPTSLRAALLDIKNYLYPLKIVPDMIVLNLVVFVAVGLIMPLMKLYALKQYEGQLNEFRFGAIVGPAAVMLGVAAVFGGRLSDRWGHVRSVIIGIALSAVGMWVVALAPPLITVIAATVLVGLGTVLAYPSWMAIAVEADPAERGRTIGAVGMAEGIGAIIGVVLGPLLYTSHRLSIPALGIEPRHVPFYLSAILLTFSFVLSATWVRAWRTRMKAQR